MKTIAFLCMSTLCLSFVSITGCGGSDTQVIEAPADATGEEQPAMEGMTDEEYNKAMEESMNN